MDNIREVRLSYPQVEDVEASKPTLSPLRNDFGVVPYLKTLLDPFSGVITPIPDGTRTSVILKSVQFSTPYTVTTGGVDLLVVFQNFSGFLSAHLYAMWPVEVIALCKTSSPISPSEIILTGLGRFPPVSL